MSYDEERQRKSRVVIETPHERREVVEQQVVRQPERERRGFSGGMVAAVALAAIAVTALILLFVMNPRDDSETRVNVNQRAAAPTPIPQATPIIVQQLPPPTTATPTTIVVPVPVPAGGTTTTTAPPAGQTTTAPPASAPPAPAANDDLALQTRLDRLIRDDAALNEAGVTGTIVSGNVTLNGAVRSEDLKARAERVAYSVKGVLKVDNRITVVP